MIRVAVIEDDPVIMDRFATAVNGAEGMIVVEQATSVVAGASLVDTGGYDVLLCDLGLPDGSGITIIAKEAAKGRNTDILVITQFADQRKVLDSIRAGARGYLLKDQSLEDCIEAIAEVRRGGSPINPIIARQLLYQLQADRPPRNMPIASSLSDREIEVLNILARGFSYAECGGILKLSSNTIGFHVKNIYRKLEVNSRAEALFEAGNQGLICRPQPVDSDVWRGSVAG